MGAIVYKALTTASRYSASLRARLESLAREQTETAINTIISIMNEQTVDARTRLAAAAMLLDRGWGKPKETYAMEGREGPALRRIVREIVHVTETQEQIDNENLVVDYHEIKTVNGNGRDP
jgi:hypothetical protein